MSAERATIVLVEDHHAAQVVLATALEARGHRVHVAATGRAALPLVAASDPDLVLLDLGLPDIDGVELLRHVRAITHCPVIVVTADDDERRIVAALDLGAADYITKPFSTPVLIARVRVALRHWAERAAVVDDEVISAGDVRLDLAGHQVMVGDEVIDLHPRQFALLAILVRNQGRVLTYEALGRAIDTSASTIAEQRNAWRVSISKLRKQLGSGPARPRIETELNVGYRLVVPLPPDSP